MECVIFIYSIYRFIVDEYIGHLDIGNRENYLSVQDMDIGPKAKDIITASVRHKKITPANAEEFYKKIQNFYFTLASQIKLKFTFNDAEMDVPKYCGFIEPASLKDVRDISPLASFFKFDVVEVAQQYKLFRNTYKDNAVKDADLFWGKVEADHGHVFNLIIALKNIVNILPHSSAACERLFSCVNSIKTDKRNRIGDKLLNGILQGKQFLNRSLKSCYDCIIPPKMLDLRIVY